MKTLKKHLRFAFLLLLAAGGSGLSASAQGGLMISAGASVVSTGSPAIVITDGKFQNDGTFTPDFGLVRMEGSNTTANSTISGSGSTTFYDFTQQKSANDILLVQNITVNNNFTMNGGLFQLNNFFVTLGTATGQIVNESETNRITGLSGGEIIKTLTLNAPAGVNPGNLGAMITSSVNMGSTTIRRGHKQQNDGNAGLSIYRYYDIIPTTNAGLNATLRQYYFDAELAGRVETELTHYNSLNAGFSWYFRNFNTRNTVSNYVEQVSYGDLATRWTLASSINQPLPVVFVDEGLRCDPDNAELFWTVAETYGTDHFQVEKSDDQVEWSAVADGYIPSVGVGRNHYTYTLTESANFFRVRHVDASGATTLSADHRLTCNVAGSWSIWPNPTANSLNVKAPFGQGMTAFEITDMLGQVVLRQSMDETALHTIELDGKVTAGIYLLKVFPAKGNAIVKKFEVRR